MSNSSVKQQNKIAKSNLPIVTRKFTSLAGIWPIKRTVNMHIHNFFELEMIIEGKGKTVINGNEYPLCPGTVYIMRPSDTHNLIPDEGTTINLRNFSFLENAVSDEIIDFLISNSIDNIIQLSEDKLRTIYALHDLIYQCQSDNNSDNNKISLKASDLMLSIIVKEMNHTCKEINNKHILSSINYMREHFSEDISVDDIAEHIGLSVPYFSSTFHASLGTKCKDYLTSLRIAHARKLIKTTKKSITDICYESGFNSFSSFHRAFVKIVHTTPAKYIRSTLPEYEPGTIRGHTE